MSDPSINTSLEVIGVEPHRNRGGRPTTFRKDVAEEICARLWEGETLTSICSEDDMPALRTAYKWMDAHPEFGHEYTRARARQSFTLVDQMRDVSKDRTIDPDRARVIIDTHKWTAARQNWRYFGDKVQVETREADKELGDADLDGGLGFLAQALIKGDK